MKRFASPTANYYHTTTHHHRAHRQKGLASMKSVDIDSARRGCTLLLLVRIIFAKSMGFELPEAWVQWAR